MPTTKSEDAPAGAISGVAFPIEWRAPSILLDCIPALRKPKLGAPVSVLGHKLQILTTRDGAVCDTEVFEIHLVTRRFVVEAKVETVCWVYGVPGFCHATMEAMPLQRGW